MKKKYSDKKAVELIFKLLQKLKRGETSFEAFAVVVALILDPVPLTEKDFEWARETASSLGLESLLTPRAADEVLGCTSCRAGLCPDGNGGYVPCTICGNTVQPKSALHR